MRVRQRITPRRLSGWLCVVGASRSHVPYIEAARKLGLQTVVVDRNPRAPGAQCGTRFVQVSTHDAAGIIDALSTLAFPGSLRGCLTASAYPGALMAVARACEALRLPGCPPVAIANTQDRQRMKRQLEDVGILTPRGRIVSTVADLRSYLDDQPRGVLKPVAHGRGSAGVIAVSARGGNLAGSMDYVRTHTCDGDRDMIVEPLLSGTEFSVDGCVQNKRIVILGITHKYTLGPNRHFVIDGFAAGVGESQSSETEKGRVSEVAELCKRAVAALSLDNCFFSFDVLDSPAGDIVLDAGALLDAKMDRLLTFAGMDPYTLRCLVATGCWTDMRNRIARYGHGFALKFLYAPLSGRLTSVGMRPEFSGEGIPFRSRVEWEREAGDYVRAPESVADVLGWVLVESRDGRAAWNDVLRLKGSSLMRVMPEEEEEEVGLSRAGTDATMEGARAQ